jgi:hypothetical protein
MRHLTKILPDSSSSESGLHPTAGNISCIDLVHETTTEGDSCNSYICIEMCARNLCMGREDLATTVEIALLCYYVEWLCNIL